MSNVEQPQSTSTRRRRGVPSSSSLPVQEKLDRDLSDASDAMAVSAEAVDVLTSCDEVPIWVK